MADSVLESVNLDNPDDQLYAHKFWDAFQQFGSSSSLPRPEREIPVIVSVFYYSFTLFCGRLLRQLITKYAPKSTHLYLGDFVLSFMVHACSLENGQLRRYYGWPGYVAALFCVGMWFSINSTENQCNPRKNLMDYMQGSMSKRRVLVRTAIQLAGGLMSYHYARRFWSLELTMGHSERFRAHHCTSDLRVPLLIGLAVECGGSVIDTVLSLTTFSRHHYAEMTTKSMLAVAMTVYGVDSTGFYVNPINASNQCWGCKGASKFEHLLVYWIGPLLVTAFTVWLQTSISSTIKNIQYSDTSLVAQNGTTSKQSLEEDYDSVDSSSGRRPSRRNSNKNKKKKKEH